MTTDLSPGNSAKITQQRHVLLAQAATLLRGEHSAETLLQQAARLCGADLLAQAEVDLWLGRSTLLDGGNQGKALNIWLQGLDKALQVEHAPLCAELWLEIGTLHRRQGDVDSALRHHEQALDFAGSHGELLARCQLALAADLFALGELPTASAVLRVAEHDASADWPATYHEILGKLVRQDGRPAQALVCYEHALQQHRQYGARGGQLRCLLRIGQLKQAAGQDGETELKAAAELASALDAARLQGDIHRELAALYEARADHARATEHYAAFLARQPLPTTAARATSKRLATIEMRLKLLTSEIELSQLREETQAGRQQLQKLENAAYRDALTQMPNRRALNERLPDLAAAAEGGVPLSLLLLDIDQLVAVNDAYSHAAGDEVLQGVAQLLLHECRDSDLPARFSGEEFVLALPGVHLAEAIKTAERIRYRIESHHWLAYPNLKITVGIGCAEYTHGDTAEILLSRADLALYLAKRAGSNRICSTPEA
ncbi:Response regulator PleD [Andreprevotia sp. IGB-42]|uniref:GGDEF domain-containing protein n=1 Tax=Andreprevotia sp. IGB-42 TaxID=2497473 RepID=UPI00135A112F|nr:GGDEF domain-containing protein [Andreprevotia sp. IGB-42]KAF0812174.1 Response regulator PleD [Andreprevotia sp. IGB-42]